MDEQTGEEDDPVVFSPEELDITDREEVVEIEEDRYVVSASGGSPDVSATATDADGTDTSGRRDERPPRTLDGPAVRGWLTRHVGAADERYGFEVTATLDDSTAHREYYSDDVVETFDVLLDWFCRNLDEGDPEQVLGILLAETDTRPRLPGSVLEAYVESEGLSPEDTIADLLETTEDGVRLPPETE